MYFQRNNECTKVKDHLLITEEKWTTFIIIALQGLQQSYYKDNKNQVQECKRCDCSVPDSLLPHLANPPPQQLREPKSEEPL